MNDRENVRLDYEMIVKIESIFDKDGSIFSTPYNEVIKFLNFSTSGVLVETENKALEVGMSFLCKIVLGGEELSILPIILRKTLDTSNGFNLLGCKFTHLNSREDYIIRKFIFQEQLKQREEEIKNARRKGKNLFR